MRKVLIAGNWKMNKNLEEAVALVQDIKAKLTGQEKADILVCPPFVNIQKVAEVCKGTAIKVGAQNMSDKDIGAYTGEISADMLKAVGAEYVILGHSERRTYYGETDAIVNAKLKKALEKGLKPIVCIGETLEERNSGKMDNVLKTQVTEGLKGLSNEQMQTVVIAYEPVWAIGTGVTATDQQAQDAQKFVRDLIAAMFDQATADQVVIQYGGSMKPDNAVALLAMADIDGGLIGGASLKAADFLAIVNAAK